MPDKARPVLLGVTRGQPDVALIRAAGFAAKFGSQLVCAHVDPVATSSRSYPTDR